jgi:hypothetical protein
VRIQGLNANPLDASLDSPPSNLTRLTRLTNCVSGNAHLGRIIEIAVVDLINEIVQVEAW